MKINFDCPTEQYQTSYGISLKPGINEVPDEIGEELIKGSDALITSLAKKAEKPEEEIRAERKGKGIFTRVKSEDLSPARRKGRGGGE